MAKKVQVRLNKAGVRQLMRSDEMMEECEKRASEALGRLGVGYSMNTRRGKTRVNAEVKADTWLAIRDNTENNSILKALK